MKPKYLSLNEIMKVVKSEYQQINTREAEWTTQIVEVTNKADNIIAIIERDLAILHSNKGTDFFETSEIISYLKEQDLNFLTLAFENFDSYVVIESEEQKQNKRIKQLYSTFKEEYIALQLENKEIKNKLKLKNEIDFGFSTKMLVAMAKAQKKYWKAGVETTPEVVRKLVIFDIVEELGLELDSENSNRKVSALVSAIAPDSMF